MHISLALSLLLLTWVSGNNLPPTEAASEESTADKEDNVDSEAPPVRSVKESDKSLLGSMYEIFLRPLDFQEIKSGGHKPF